MKHLHKAIVKHGKKVTTHVRKHHKKYIGGAFAGFAVFKTIKLVIAVIGFLISLNNVQNTFADMSHPDPTPDPTCTLHYYGNDSICYSDYVEIEMSTSMTGGSLPYMGDKYVCLSDSTDCLEYSNYFQFYGITPLTAGSSSSRAIYLPAYYLRCSLGSENSQYSGYLMVYNLDKIKPTIQSGFNGSTFTGNECESISVTIPATDQGCGSGNLSYVWHSLNGDTLDSSVTILSGTAGLQTLSYSVRDGAKPHCENIQGGGPCTTYNDTIGEVYFQWKDVWDVSGNQTYNTGTITGSITISNLLTTLGITVGDCEPVSIQILNSGNASCQIDDNNNLVIIPYNNLYNQTGFCELSISDDDGHTATGRVNFNVKTTPKCNEDWNNDNFLSGGFWSLNPTDEQIICALYGSGTDDDKTAYTVGWSGFTWGNSCNVLGMDVVHTNTLPTTLSSNTIYVLETGKVINNGAVDMANCSAIVSRSGSVLYSSNQITSNGQISSIFKQYMILDNLAIDGKNDGNGLTHTGAIGIYLNQSDNNTLNNIQIYNSNLYGIYLNVGNDNNILNNIQSYNNADVGIYLNDSNNNILNNIQSYNNGFYGILLNNSLSNYNILNNVQSYNNLNCGIALKNSSSNNTLNNIKSFNNGQAGILLSNSSNNKYYGELSIFGNSGTNGNDVPSGLTAATTSNSVGRTAGQYSTIDNEYEIEHSIWNYITNPKMTGDAYMLSFTGNRESLRGVKSLTEVDGYSYGINVQKQVQPMVFSGESLITGGSFDRNEYIGGETDVMVGKAVRNYYPQSFQYEYSLTGVSTNVAKYQIFVLDEHTKSASTPKSSPVSLSGDENDMTDYVTQMTSSGDIDGNIDMVHEQENGDGIAPSVTLTWNGVACTTGGQVFVVTGTFTEAVSGVVESTLSVENGSVVTGSFTGISDTVYRWQVRSDTTLHGEWMVKINSGTYTDLAGNTGSESNTLSGSFDNVGPTYNIDDEYVDECTTGNLIIKSVGQVGCTGTGDNPYSWNGGSSWSNSDTYSLYSGGVGTKTITVRVRDDLGNYTEKTGAFIWTDSEITLSGNATGAYDIGNITGITVISNLTGLFNVTGYGSCETVTITTGPCIDATMTFDGSNLTIIPDDSADGTGSCKIYFSDGDTTKTGVIFFHVNKLHCLSGWNNDDFLDSRFWWGTEDFSGWNDIGDTRLQDEAIICALYGSGEGDTTAYTKNWEQNNCNQDDLVVQEGIGNGGELLENTIYLMNDNVSLTESIQMNNCSAIVSINDSGFTFETDEDTHGYIQCILNNGNQGVILNGVNVSGCDEGIALLGVKNNTLHKIQVHDNNIGIVQKEGERNIFDMVYSYNNREYGIKYGGDAGIFNNIQLYGNNGDGILLDGSHDTVFNMIYSYSNGRNGINLHESNNIAFNNVQTYNNGENGIIHNNGNFNTFNNIQSYSNNADGIEISESNNILFNNIQVYQNKSEQGISLLDGSENIIFKDVVLFNNMFYTYGSCGEFYYCGLYSLSKKFKDDSSIIESGSNCSDLGGDFEPRDIEYISDDVIFWNRITNPINESGVYMYDWKMDTSDVELGLTMYSGRTYAYSYGMNIMTQKPPLKYEGDDLTGYMYDFYDGDDKYVGSDVSIIEDFELDVNSSSDNYSLDLKGLSESQTNYLYSVFGNIQSDIIGEQIGVSTGITFVGGNGSKNIIGQIWTDDNFATHKAYNVELNVSVNISLTGGLQCTSQTGFTITGTLSEDISGVILTGKNVRIDNVSGILVDTGIYVWSVELLGGTGKVHVEGYLYGNFVTGSDYVIGNLDNRGPTFTFANNTVNECITGSLSITSVAQVGCATGHSLPYSWNGGSSWSNSGSYSLYSSGIGSQIVTVRVRDGLGNYTEKTGEITWRNAELQLGSGEYNLGTITGVTVISDLTGEDVFDVTGYGSCETVTITTGQCTGATMILSGNSLTINPDLNHDGMGSCEIYFTDGDTQKTGVVTFDIDTKKPEFIGEGLGFTGGLVGGEMCTTQTGFTITGTFSEAVTGVVLTGENVEITENSEQGTGVYTWTVELVGGTGEVRLTGEIKDLNGNEISEAYNTHYIVGNYDNVGPNAINGLSPNGTIYTNYTTLSWNNATDSGCAGMSGYNWALYSGNDCEGESLSGGFVGGTGVDVENLSDGAYCLSVQPVDYYGNMGEIATGSFDVDTAEIGCIITTAPACTSGEAIVYLSGALNDENMYLSWEGTGNISSMIASGRISTGVTGNGKLVTGYIYQSGTNKSNICTGIVNNYDNQAPTITGGLFTGYECETITGSVSASDEGCGSENLSYSWSGLNFTGTSYGINNTGKLTQTIQVSVVDGAGNTETIGVIYEWLDRELTMTGIYNLGLLTGQKVISDLTGENVFNVTGYGSCETVTIITGECINATMSLSGSALTIIPSDNIEGTGSCEVYFTDGDTTKTGVVSFEVDNTEPGFTGNGLGFTGGLVGGEQCTTRTGFTITGTFSEAVTGVKLTGENVKIIDNNTQGTDVYTWEVELIGGTGSVRLTGDIRDLHGNELSDFGNHYIVGNYDSGNIEKVTLKSPISGTVLTGGNRTGNFVWSGLTKDGCAEITGYEIWLCTGTQTENTGCDTSIWTGWTNGTGVSTGELEDGMYYWKVQGQDEYGRTGEWSEVWNFRVDNIEPTFTGEGYGFTGGIGEMCTTRTGFTITGIFSEAVTGVKLTGEYVRINNEGGITNDSGITYTWEVELLGGTGKVWLTGNIADLDGNELSGGYGSHYIVGNYDNVGPDEPILNSPGSGIIFRIRDINFEWTSGDNITGCAGWSGYIFQISTGDDENFDSNIIEDRTGILTGKILSEVGFENGTYYWRVISQDKNGNENVSEIRSFEVDSSGASCLITQPENCAQTGNVTIKDSSNRVIKSITGSDLTWLSGDDSKEWTAVVEGKTTLSGIIIELLDGQTGMCHEFTTSKLDNTGPEISVTNVTGYECEMITGIVVAQTGDSCGKTGLDSFSYSWSGGIFTGTEYGISNNITGEQTLSVVVSDSVGNSITTGVTYAWLDTGVVLLKNETGITIQEILTGSYVGESSLFEIFEPTEGACNTGLITISTGNCYLSGSRDLFTGVEVSLTGNNTKYQINIDGQVEGYGYCEVLFNDDDGNTATGKINFYVDTRNCLDERDNDHFLIPDFWGMVHNDNQVICALYGSGTQDPQTAYTMGWSGYDGTQCSGFDEMDVVRTDNLLSNLSENTIYVLTESGTNISSTIEMPNCTAIVSSMVDGYDTVLYSDNQISSMISLSGQYGILDNVSVDGRNKKGELTHDLNELGIILSGAENNTFNVVKVYNNTGDGIKVVNSQLNLLNNLQLYANAGAGIELINSNYNSIDNGHIHRNTNGIILNNSKNNIISLFKVYSNKKIGLTLTGDTNDNIFNQIHLHSNYAGVVIKLGLEQKNKVYGKITIQNDTLTEYNLMGGSCQSISGNYCIKRSTSSNSWIKIRQYIDSSYSNESGDVITSGFWNDGTGLFNFMQRDDLGLTLGQLETWLGISDPIRSIINPYGNGYLYDWFGDYKVKGPNSITKVEKYSYGVSVGVQSRPLIWSGGDIALGGKVATGNYIGSNVPRVTGNLAKTKITKVEHVFTGSSNDTGLVDTFELLRGDLPYPYTGLQFRSWWDENEYHFTKTGLATTLIGEINTDITVYVKTGTQTATYSYVPQYYGENYFATHYGVETVSVEAPRISFSPITNQTTSNRQKEILGDGLQISYNSSYGWYCVNSGTVNMTGIWTDFYEYMTGFTSEDLSLTNAFLEPLTFKNESYPKVSGNIWTWTLTGLTENVWASLTVSGSTAEDATEILNTATYIQYYYDTTGPAISSVAGTSVNECTATIVTLSANDECYVSGYMFTGFVGQDWTEGGSLSINSGDIGRTGNTQKSLTGYTRDWLEYETETGITITINNIEPTVTTGNVSTGFDNGTWSGNLIDLLGAQEGNCGTGDLSATGLSCSGMSGSLDGNNLLVEWSTTNATTSGYCEVMIVDNEYTSENTGSFVTGKIKFTRDVTISFNSGSVQTGYECEYTTGHVDFIFAGGDITYQWNGTTGGAVYALKGDNVTGYNVNVTGCVSDICTTGTLYYSWNDTGVQLSSGEISVGELTGEYITTTGDLIDLFGAREGNCGSGEITVTTGNCENATISIDDEGNVVITPEQDLDNGTGSCEVVFHDDDKNSMTGTINFGADTLVWHCLDSWNNDNFLNSGFWNSYSGENSIVGRSQVICALYGSGAGDQTAYTMGWSGYEGSDVQCSGLRMKVVYTGQMEGQMQENTIYVLTGDEMNMNTTITGARCSAIVSKGGTEISSENNLSYQISTKNSSYGIFDNISVNGTNNGAGGLKIESSNVSVNNIMSYNNINDGIFISKTNNIIINNVQLYNNSRAGLAIYSGYKYSINNIQLYNNGKAGLWIESTINNVFNGIKIYNNKDDGLRLVSTNNNIFNDIYIYNNGYTTESKPILYSGSVSNNKYYGTFAVFGNENTGDLQGFTGSDESLLALGWTSGQYIDTGILSRDMMTNPVDSGGSYLLEWKSDFSELRGTGEIGEVVGYSYGSGIGTQQQPVMYVNGQISIGGNYFEDYYIGSQVSKVTGDLQVPSTINTNEIIVTGDSEYDIVGLYSIFGNINTGIIGEQKGQSTGIKLKSEGENRLVVQLWNTNPKYFATHFEKNVTLNSEFKLIEFTGGYGSAQCTNMDTFTVTGTFSRAVTGVVLTGENVEITSSNNQGSTGYTWTVKLTGGIGKVWIITGDIELVDGGGELNMGENISDTIILGNYDNVGPNKTTLKYPLGEISISNPKLSWEDVIDSGCALVSGYNWELYSGNDCEGTPILSGFTIQTGVGVSDLNNGQIYCRGVQSVDDYGNTGEWSTGTFTVNTDNIGCKLEVVGDLSCTSGTAQVKLMPENTSLENIYLSFTGFESQDLSGALQLLTTVTQSGQVVTGYIYQSGVNKTGVCYYTATNIIDQIKPTIETGNVIVYECTTGTAVVTGEDEGCSEGILYSWSGGEYVNNNQYSLYSGGIGTRIVNVKVKDSVGNETGTSVTFEWRNSEISGHDFTGSENVGNSGVTVNWKTLSEVTDGECGSGTIEFSGFVSTGSHGTCTTGEGDEIIYTPNIEEEYEGSDSCKIQVKDDEGSGKIITITFTGIDTKKPTCEINYNSECTSGGITLSMTATGASKYSWTGFDNMSGNNHNFVVELNGRYTGYVKDAAGNTGICSTGVNNISTGTLSAPTNLSPASGTNTNKTPTLSRSGASANGCRTVSGYEVYVLSGEGVVASGIVSSGTTNWEPEYLGNGTYEWYVVTHDTLGGLSESEYSIFTINDNQLTCTITYPNQCTSGTIDLTMTVNNSLSGEYEGWTISETNNKVYTMSVNENTGFNFVVTDIAGNTGSCSVNVTNFDNIVPIITGDIINATGYECETITGYVQAEDSILSCGGLYYKWNGGLYSGENKTGYGIRSDVETGYDVLVQISDGAGNMTGATVHYTWIGRDITLGNSGYNLGIITGTTMINDLTGDSVFNVTGYGSCENVTITIGECTNATMSLNENNLSIMPNGNYEGTGSCEVYFTDGDTTKTGVVTFDIDTKKPQGTGVNGGLNGGNGGSCTTQNEFVVTGTFTEAVTGVILTGENVIINDERGISNDSGVSYTWIVELLGGTGKVLLTGNIVDLMGNTLSGIVPELILGNYDGFAPNKTTLISPQGIVPFTNTTLKWTDVVDIGCAGLSGYNWKLYSGNSCTGIPVQSGFGQSSQADVSNLSNKQTYCRGVQPVDNNGNIGEWSTGVFTVDTDGISCSIVANRTTCGSGNVTLTLRGSGQWLSWTSVGNTGMMSGVNSLVKIVSSFENITGYTQNSYGQTGYCVFTKEQLERIMDKTGSHLSGNTKWSGYECTTGIINMNADEDGCGSSGMIYKWNGTVGGLSKSVFGSKAQILTGIFSVVNGAGITVNTGYKFEWIDSPVTAVTGFVVDFASVNSVNWKDYSQATDGACGSGTLTAIVTGATKGICSISGDNLIYTPNEGMTGSDSCILTISDDDGGSGVDVQVQIENINPYVELITPENDKEFSAGEVYFEWRPVDVPSYRTVSGFIYTIGDKTGFTNDTGVNMSLSAGTYPWSVFLVYADGKTGGLSRVRSVKTVASSSSNKLVRDYCPYGDNSDSYYDGVCDNINAHEVANLCGINESKYTSESKGAYLYAYLKGITTQCPIQNADLDGYLYRDQLAKMISVYAINVVGRKPNYGKTGCDQFSDMSTDTKEFQDYMKLSCELGLMGLNEDGVTPKTYFDPHSIVTRAEFGTVFSRLLFGDMYNVKNGPEVRHIKGYWYRKHLQALKDYGVMTKVDGDWPEYKERRGRTMLMLQRADNYGIFEGKSPAKNGVDALFTKVDSNAV